MKLKNISRIIRLVTCLALLVSVIGIPRILALPAQKLPLKFTDKFVVEYLDHGLKRITDGAGRPILLVPRGAKIPSAYRGLCLEIPLRRVIFASATQVSLLRPLQSPAVWRSVVGVTLPLDQWYIEEVKQGLAGGAITYIGDSYKPDYELIRVLQPEVVFVYQGPSGLTRMIQKLNELKIPYVVDNDYLEEEPLGRLEWLKFIAAFYDQEPEAEEFLDQAIQKVREIEAQVKGRPKPEVAWGMLFSGKAYVPSGRSFVARMFNQVGADYVIKAQNSKGDNFALSLEEFCRAAGTADRLIYASMLNYAPSLSDLKKEPVLGSFKAVRSGNVWCFQPWYFQSLDKTDEIIADLAAICHPELFKGYRVKHFVRLK